MPRTFRELLWAYRGHEYAEWERLSHLQYLIAEVNRDKKKKPVPFKPTDFFRRPGAKTASSSRLTVGAFRAMKGMFVKKR